VVVQDRTCAEALSALAGMLEGAGGTPGGSGPPREEGGLR
jgi:hypothetical protein